MPPFSVYRPVTANLGLSRQVETDDTTIKTKEMELTKIIVQNIELNEKLKNALELDMALFKSVSGFVEQINESIEKYFLAKSKVWKTF